MDGFGVKWVRKFGGVLTPEQAAGASSILTRFSTGRSARFILNDGPGMGKTKQLLAAAWQVAASTGKTSYVLTKNGELADQIHGDAQDCGIKSRHVVVGLHGDKTPRACALFIDEAHAAESAQIDGFAGPVALASAEAFATPRNSVWFMARTLGLSEGSVLSLVGVDNNLVPDVTRRNSLLALRGIRDTLVSEGAAISRFLPFNGEARAVPIDVGLDATKRAKSVAAIAKAEFRDGRTPVIAAPADALEGIAAAIGGRIPVQTTVDGLRARPRSIMLLPMDTHGEGIRLHDKSGRHPRSLIAYMPSDVGLALQLEGRVSRRNSASESRAILPFDPVADEACIISLLKGAAAARLIGDRVPVTIAALAEALPPGFASHSHPMVESIVASIAGVRHILHV